MTRGKTVAVTLNGSGQLGDFQGWLLLTNHSLLIPSELAVFIWTYVLGPKQHILFWLGASSLGTGYMKQLEAEAGLCLFLGDVEL